MSSENMLIDAEENGCSPQQIAEQEYYQKMEWEQDQTREAIAKMICMLLDIDANEYIPIEDKLLENGFIGNRKTLYCEISGTDTAKIYRYVKRWQTLLTEVKVFQKAIEAQHHWMKLSDPFYLKEVD